MIYLAQTDTTVGFLSTDKEALAKAKGRSKAQPFIMVCDSFKKQKALVRTPKRFRSLVRRAKKTTFIYPNDKAVRVSKDQLHNRLLKRFDYLYSTSANRHQESFDIKFATSVADVVVLDGRDLVPKSASKMIKLGKKVRKMIR